MNDIEWATYLNGEDLPMEQDAVYLRGRISANGSYKEIANSIANTWLMARKPDLLWKRHLSL